MLRGELRDGRGNDSCRGLSVERQVRDLAGFLALSLPFPVYRFRPAARNCSPLAARFRPAGAGEAAAAKLPARKNNSEIENA
ncbi:MAG TPA: hypothetical protein VF456_28160 [Vicinamibacterales bacterium]